MKKYIPLIRVGIVAALLAAGSSGARSRWIAQIGLDFWSLPRLNQEIEENLKQMEELAAASEATHQRMALKDELVQELVDGRLDLLSAAAQFRNINIVYDDYVDLLHMKYDGLTDEECICRNVIDYVHIAISDQVYAETVLTRLEAEFKRFHQLRGYQHLPL